MLGHSSDKLFRTPTFPPVVCGLFLCSYPSEFPWVECAYPSWAALERLSPFLTICAPPPFSFCHPHWCAARSLLHTRVFCRSVWCAVWPLLHTEVFCRAVWCATWPLLHTRVVCRVVWCVVWPLLHTRVVCRVVWCATWPLLHTEVFCRVVWCAVWPFLPTGGLDGRAMGRVLSRSADRD